MKGKEKARPCASQEAHPTLAEWEDGTRIQVLPRGRGYSQGGRMGIFDTDTVALGVAVCQGASVHCVIRAPAATVGEVYRN